MLFCLGTALIRVLIHFGFYQIAKTIRMDPVLFGLAFLPVNEINRAC